MAEAAALVTLIQSPYLRWEHINCGMIDIPHMHHGVDCDEPHPCNCKLGEARALLADPSPAVREMLAKVRAWERLEVMPSTEADFDDPDDYDKLGAILHRIYQEELDNVELAT